jgi:hypothetical protein
MRLIRLAGVLALAGMLAACGTKPKGSVLGSEGGAIKPPDYAIKGATDFDQRWIDETVETGVSALGWKRPAPRPPEWDRPLAPIATDAAAIAEPAQMGTPPKPKKKRWRDRLIPKWLHRHKKPDAPVEGG